MSDENNSKGVTASDLKLLGRLTPYVSDLKFMIFLGAFLVLLAAVASVILPYVTKLAIDHYIVPMTQKVTLTDKGPIPAPLVEALASGDTYDSGEPGTIFLKPEAFKHIDPRQEKDLIKAGFLSTERYYIYPLTSSENPPEVVKNSQHLIKYPLLLAIEEKKLAKEPENFTLILRAADLEGLKKLAIYFTLLMLMAYAFEFAQRVILEIVTQRISHKLRQNLLKHLFELSQSFFDRSQSARLTSRLTNDVNNLSNLTKTTVATLFNDIVSLAVIIIIMFSLSPKLALITISFTPLTIWLSSYFGRKSREVQRNLRSRLGVINQSFSETIGGINIIQAFKREEVNTQNFQKLNYENYLAGLKQIRINAIFVPLIDVFASIILALVIWYGGGEVLAGSLSIGVVAAFVGYARRFFMPIQDMAEKLNIFQSAFASLERLTELMDADEKIEMPAHPLAPAKPGGSFEFKNVCFRYIPDGPLVLKDLSFKVKRGEQVALVGQTGSGKSSIINLMQRNYDPQSGEILFDSQPLKQLDLAKHNARIGLVSQDVYLYAGTVMDNLRLGRKNLSNEEIQAACQAVGADLFIKRLPRGYDEHLGASGRRLSAGERQLLACARALIETPEIIILDEATASVDSESEMLIEKALHTLFQGRTSITIAHRLATIRRVERILVLHDGRLIEDGNHQELIEKKGAYYRLALLQGLA